MSNPPQPVAPSTTERRRKACCLAPALFLIAAPVVLFVFLWILGGFLVVGDAIQPVDAVVLLSGGDDARLAEAVRIYQSGLANHLLITETGTVPEGGGPRASALLQRQAEAAGVAADAIWTTLGKSTSTQDEAAAVLEFCQRKGLTGVIVVTDPYHTRRTRFIFRTVFSGSDIRVLVRPVRGHWYQSTTWFLSLRGWRATLTEYAKLFAALLGLEGG